METDQNDALARLEALDRIVAQRRVRSPGIALMTVGGIWIMSGLAALAGAAIIAVNESDSTQLASNIALVVVGLLAVFGISVLVVGGTTAVGGYRLLQLRSRRTVIVGAVAAILSAAFASAASIWALVSGAFGCMAILLLMSFMLGSPIAIWALIVVRDDVVKAAFR